MPNFESFSRQLIARSAEPLLTVRKHGVIAFNATAYRALDEPAAVALRFDRARGMVSVAQVDHRHAQARFVRAAGRTGAPPYLVSATSFLRAHGILSAISCRWNAVVEDGILYAHLAVPAKPAYAVIVS